MSAYVHVIYGHQRRARVVVCKRRGGKGEERTTTGRSRSAKRSNLYRRLEAYGEHFLRLSRLDFGEEQEVFRLRQRESNLQKLISDGVVLIDLIATDDGLFFSDNVISFSSFRRENFPRHVRFSQGDIVDISRGLEEIRGTVLQRTRSTLRVIPEDQEVDIQGPGWRIDLGFNAITHERICSALEQVVEIGKASGRDQVMNLICGSFQAEQVLAVRKLLNAGPVNLSEKVAYTLTSPSDDNIPWDIEEQAKQLPTHFNKTTKQRAAALVKTYTHISSTQQRAVLNAVCRRISLTQGPPGTGKTRTACATIRALVALRSVPILVCAASNTATDNLLEGLTDLKVVRVGRAVSVRESLRSLTLEAKVERSQAVKTLSSKLIVAEGDRHVNVSPKAVRAAIADAKANAAARIIAKADVIVTTCTSCRATELLGVQFPVVVIDEATQATEPATLLPMLNGCEQLVLIGDHHQLPPTVISKEAAEQGLDVSLFSRLWSLGMTPHLLNIQYRMHPLLSSFPSESFYKGKVISHHQEHERKPPPSVPWKDSNNPLLFIRVDDEEERSGKSYTNRSQARIAAEMVAKALMDGKLMPKDIGVVTPYSAQVRIVYDCLAARGVDTASIEVSSVDGFQGREKELIIFSSVRSNEGRILGFTSDWRRLNVSLTRARRGLIVIGSEFTLSADKIWSKWVRFVKKNKSVSSKIQLVLPD